MSNNFGFESLENIKKSYHSFDINERTFGKLTKFCKYHGGVPLMYDIEEHKVYVDNSDTHTLVYGSTGSKKTRNIVEPTIKILGKAGESIIINDSKGEIYNRLAGELKDEGYKIITINLRNPMLGNAWNPLKIPYEFYINGDIDRAAGFANDIANNIMKSYDSNDPFWTNSAANTCMGLLMLLFRYCKDHDEPDSAVNISNVFKLSRKIFEESGTPKFSPIWKYASEDEITEISLSGAVNAATETRGSIMSVFNERMKSLTIQPSLMDMLSNNDFDIADIVNTKTAVFIISPDEKETYNSLCALFIKQSYEYFIYLASQRDDNKVPNRVNYCLDEFTAMPTIDSFPSMITAARSRDIRFNIIVQSKGALKRRYKEEAETIISNCTNWVFFTSRELELLRELSELCGEKSNHTRNISIYDLQHFSKEKNEALVFCGRLKPAKVRLLDIDRYGDTRYTILQLAKHDRTKRKLLTFELKEEIKERVTPKIPDNPFKTPPKSPSIANPFLFKDNDEQDSSLANDELWDGVKNRIQDLEENETEKKDSKPKGE